MSDVLEPGAENTILENLEEIYAELNSVFNSHSQRLLEFKVVVSEGIKRAQEAISIQHSRVIEILENNAGLARQTAVDMGSVTRFDALQVELSDQIKELSTIDVQLGEDIAQLTAERDELTKYKKNQVLKIDEMTGEIQGLNTKLDHLERDNDALKKEKTLLTKEESRLLGEVQRLKDIKGEFLSSIARYKEIKSGLMT